MGRKGATDSFWGVRNPQNSTRVTSNGEQGRGWGGRSKGEGDLDAEGGMMVAIGKSLWTRNQKLHINTANSRISISVYFNQITIRAGQWEGQTVHKEGG